MVQLGSLARARSGEAQFGECRSGLELVCRLVVVLHIEVVLVLAQFFELAVYKPIVEASLKQQLEFYILTVYQHYHHL